MRNNIKMESIRKLRIRTYGSLLICLFILSCQGRSERLKAVLEYSGANRAELEKVLDHYSVDPADSLKLKSAIFLIEQMPGHYTFGGPFMEDYCARVDTVSRMPYYEKKILQIIPFEAPDYRSRLEIREDVKCIKGDFLIHQIETAFRQWQENSWLEELDFNTFCEYLLPYRVENEPLDYWRDSLSPFAERLQACKDYYDDCRHSISHLVNKFYSYNPALASRIPEKGLKDYQMECISTSKLNLFTLRTVGVPAAIDYTPHFANRNGRHYWTTSIDPKLKQFQVPQTNLYRMAKIYRRMFSHHPKATPGKNEYIPPFFLDAFNKDVTNLYLPTQEVVVKIPRQLSLNHAYLAIFNDLTWKPISCTQPSGGKAVFPDMGKDILYLPVYYDENEEMCPFAPPLILTSEGTTIPLNLRKDSTQKMSLVRKYPYHSYADYWSVELMHTCFETSDDAGFKHTDTIFRITEKMNYEYQFIKTDTTLKRRYWRISPAFKGRSHLADLHFYDTRNREIQGKITGLDSIREQILSDTDPLSMCMIDQITVDFGKSTALSGIRYLGRNDANGIYPENEYELFYYDIPEGWVSLGSKTATGYSIEYDQVPTGGLYWLRNLSSGQEERIFTWENGKARFW